ncbi:DNA-binding protein, partial [Paracoccus sp. PXZ]
MAALRHLQRRTGAKAMALVTCVGSLTRAMIRHANRDEASEYRGHFEITALTGTIGPAGQHLHLTIADGEGRAFGG